MERLETEKRHGYKITKLGWIPHEWKIVKVNEVFDFIPTNSYSRKQLHYEATDESFYNIHYGDIHSTYHEPILDFEKEENIPVLIEDFTKQNTLSYLRDGDVVIADASEDYDGVGEAIELANTNGKKVLAGLHTFALRDHNNWTTQGFRAYIFKNTRVAKAIKVIATGSKVFGISKRNLEKFEIVLPPIIEQQKIAQVLTTWDKAIAKTEMLIKQKQKRKQGLMQQLLTGNKRFKEFVKSDQMKETKLGWIPEDWEVVKVDDVAKVGAGGTPSTRKKEYWNGEIRWMNSGELNLKYVFEVEGRITELGLKNSSTKLLQKNCVLIGLAGQGKTRGTAAINKVELCTNQSVAFIDPKKDTLDYLFLFYNLDYRYEELRRLSTGEGGRGGLNLKIIKGVKLAMPSIIEQQKIASIFSFADNEINSLKTQLKKLQKQKKGLMQKLLTGEVRVKIEEG